MPAYPKEFKTYISNLVKFLRLAILHGEWGFNVTYMQKGWESHDDSQTLMRVWCDEVYLNFEVEISPSVLRMWKEGGYKRIGGYMCHELLHLITTPIQVLLMDDASPSQEKPFRSTVERQTQRIANILQTWLPDEWYLPKNLEKALA